MSENHEHTEFLKHCLRYDISGERDQMLGDLVRLQQESRLFRRASLLMVFLIIPAVGALLFSDFLLENLSRPAQREIVNLLVAIFFGLLACLFTFLIMRFFVRKKLHLQRAKCRKLLRSVLAARLDPGAGANPPKS